MKLVFRLCDDAVVGWNHKVISIELDPHPLNTKTLCFRNIFSSDESVLGQMLQLWTTHLILRKKIFSRCSLLADETADQHLCNSETAQYDTTCLRFKTKEQYSSKCSKNTVLCVKSEQNLRLWKRVDFQGRHNSEMWPILWLSSSKKSWNLSLELYFENTSVKITH